MEINVEKLNEYAEPVYKAGYKKGHSEGVDEAAAREAKYTAGTTLRAVEAILGWIPYISEPRQRRAFAQIARGLVGRTPLYWIGGTAASPLVKAMDNSLGSTSDVVADAITEALGLASEYREATER